MTPTYTFSATPTITTTYTITPTYTNPETPTITPTNTPEWIIVATYGVNNISHPKLTSDRTQYSFAYIYKNTDLNVNGTTMATQINNSKTGGKWLYKNSSCTFVTFANTSNNIFARSGSNWYDSIGNTSIAAGYFPNIYVDINSTMYVAYINNSSNKINVKYFNGTIWQNYGSPDFSTNVKYNITEDIPMVLHGYNNPDLKLCVAYIVIVN